MSLLHDILKDVVNNDSDDTYTKKVLNASLRNLKPLEFIQTKFERILGDSDLLNSDNSLHEGMTESEKALERTEKELVREESLKLEIDQTESLEDIEENTEESVRQLILINELLGKLLKGIENLDSKLNDTGGGFLGDVDVGTDGGRRGRRGSNRRGGGSGRRGVFGRILNGGRNLASRGASAIASGASSLAGSVSASTLAKGLGRLTGVGTAIWAGAEGGSYLGDTKFGEHGRRALGDALSFLGNDEYKKSVEEYYAVKEQSEVIDPQNEAYIKEFKERLQTEKMSREKAEFYKEQFPDIDIKPEQIIDEEPVIKPEPSASKSSVIDYETENKESSTVTKEQSTSNTNNEQKTTDNNINIKIELPDVSINADVKEPDKSTQIFPLPISNESVPFSSPINIEESKIEIKEQQRNLDEEKKKTEEREEKKLTVFEQIRDTLLVGLIRGGKTIASVFSSESNVDNSSNQKSFVRQSSNISSNVSNLPSNSLNSSTSNSSSFVGPMLPGMNRESLNDTNSKPAGETQTFRRNKSSGTSRTSLKGADTVLSNEPLIRKSEATNFIEWIGEADAGALGKEGLSKVYGQPRHGLDLTTLTVGEVREKQKVWKADNLRRGLASSAAAGGYQLMDYTIDDLVKRGVISPDDMFDLETQKKAAHWLATEKAGRGPVKEWLAAKEKLDSGEIDRATYDKLKSEAANSLSKEWAALPDPKRGGGSHYGKDGFNKATRTMAQTYDAMDKLPFFSEEPISNSRQPVIEQDSPDSIISSAKSDADALTSVNNFVNSSNNETNNTSSNNNNKPTTSTNQPLTESSKGSTPMSMSSNENRPLSTRNDDNAITRLTDKYFRNGVM